MGSLEIKFLVILGVLIGLEQANAIDCYKCYTSDSSCNDPFKTSGAASTACIGSCFKIKAKESNTQAAMRGCLPIVAEDKCEERSFGGVSGTMCSCTGNLCNYAVPVGSSIIVMTAALIVCVGLR
ncbi:hypothetical protein ACJMK2_002145 [Sinanodonta woodiana]|uniref:Protein quiver n=1 Tax=Sinanodonta woodiana TaxID=1069815 RepID=A0ABD3XUC7_SINWO